MRRGPTATAACAALLLLAACGSTARPPDAAPTATAPPALVAQARPIGRSAKFQPPANGPVVGRCDQRLGPRDGAHVEVFAANRVLLVPAGIGTRPPRSFSSGRISTARCYGELVTLDPTGVVLVRPGSHPALADLSARGASPCRPATRVVLGIQRRARSGVRQWLRWRGSPSAVTLEPHSEIVLEVGPYVSPHRSYTFPPGR
jgi:hypothetical protein